MSRPVFQFARCAATHPDIAAAACKATRRFMFDTLVQLGALDITDAQDIARCLNQLQRLLVVLGEPAAPWHEATQALRHGAASQRRGVAAQLYRDLSGLVILQMQRMQGHPPQSADGPTEAASRLHALSDDELRDALFWMDAALNPQELAAVLDALHAGGGARFQAALEALGERLGERRWDQLACALDLTRQIAPGGAGETAVAAMAA
jgi:hypothetical protein